ncbi:molybdopterin oxidoreductase family protein, partial [Actinopolyspora mortivallis]|uniref:molybdopterin oxidoreductase family protein n=1 Tax=Actinopolyspora mortivallis TaxID=33906 RepID=UPI00037B4307
EELPGPGSSAYELLDGLGTSGGARALLVFGSNPVVSAPRSAHVERRLEALDLLVVADFVPSETAEMADVVLPVTQWAEEEGTMTNLEGRVLRRREVLPPPGEARSDLEVLHGLAVRLGQDPARFPTHAPSVFDELARASAGGPADYSGITYQRLDAGEQLHWPCPRGTGESPHPGTPRMFLDSFAHPDGRARFVAVDWSPTAGVGERQPPLVATTGRIMEQYQTGVQTRRVHELSASASEGFVRLHPDVAARAGVSQDQRTVIRSEYGEVRARAELDESIRRDTVFLPIHYGGGEGANLLTGPDTDPSSGIPEFKVCPVSITAEEASGCAES